ncbi:MAG: aminotransferase class I/II-fold pyridoxal phosphate-dependent enzyme [Firmicutes bacterium]|nr:aminotransferase class I/II-fold pyridoxal phosphate-dependent enzyme [Bacillota bacterium]
MLFEKGVHGGDIYRNDIKYDFSANINPLGTPEAVKQAVRDFSERLCVYPDPACTKLREALSLNLSVPAENIICGNGAAELIFLFAAALKKKRVLIAVPSFFEYEAALNAFGIEKEFYRLKRENDFSIGEDILEKISPEHGALMLCSPNNPTGIITEASMLQKILLRCRETGTRFFLDQSFLEFVEESESADVLRLISPEDDIFVLRSFTKLYAMAGIRLGFGICPNRAFLERMSKSGQPWNVSGAAQEAGLAALKEKGFAEKTVGYIAKERRYLAKGLREMNIPFIEGRANFILFWGEHGLMEKLLSKGILIRDCSNFRGLDKGAFRIAVRTREENEQLLSALKNII